MKNEKYIYFFLAIFLIVNLNSAFGDEALLEVYGGGLKLQDGSGNIKMESETVIIEIGKENYTVDATFEFFNYGKTVTAKVGFPKSGCGYYPDFKGVINFLNFETWVDGEKIKPKEFQGEIKINDKTSNYIELEKFKKRKSSFLFEEMKWLIKEITFQENKTTITRVRYTAPYGRFNEVEYLYGTGRSWKGNIGIARFIIKTIPEQWIVTVHFSEDGVYENKRNYKIKRLSEFIYEYTLYNFEPKDKEIFRVLTSSYEQPWEGSYRSTANEYKDKYIEKELLEILSLWQLRIFRNSFYASYGKIFNDDLLNKYFKECLWYKPNKNFKESELNKIEKKNIVIIMEYEEKLKKEIIK